jgi:hypothetical protein
MRFSITNVSACDAAVRRAAARLAKGAPGLPHSSETRAAINDVTRKALRNFLIFRRAVLVQHHGVCAFLRISSRPGATAGAETAKPSPEGSFVKATGPLPG